MVPQGVDRAARLAEGWRRAAAAHSPSRDAAEPSAEGSPKQAQHGVSLAVGDDRRPSRAAAPSWQAGPAGLALWCALVLKALTQRRSVAAPRTGALLSPTPQESGRKTSPLLPLLLGLLQWQWPLPPAPL